MKKYILIFAVLVLAACAQAEPAQVMLATPTAAATKTAYYWGSVERLTTIGANTTPGWIEVATGVFRENPGGDQYVRQNIDGGLFVFPVYVTATPSPTLSPVPTLTPSITPLVPVVYTLTFTPLPPPTQNQIPFEVVIIMDVNIHERADVNSAIRGTLRVNPNLTIEILSVSKNGETYWGKLGRNMFIRLEGFTSWVYGQEP